MNETAEKMITEQNQAGLVLYRTELFIRAARHRPIELQAERLYDATMAGTIPGFLMGTGLRHLIVKSNLNPDGSRWIHMHECRPHPHLHHSPFQQCSSKDKSRDEMILQLYEYIIRTPHCLVTHLHDIEFQSY